MAVTGLLNPDNFSGRQKRILAMIRQWVDVHGYPPTVREIGDAVGLVSPSSVAYQLKELERKGFLRRDADRPRAVDVRRATEKRRTERGGSFTPLLPK